MIPGNVPDPLAFPEGCKFWPRCLFAEDICRSQEPLLEKIGDGHTAACHFRGKIDKKLWKEKTNTQSFLNINEE